jgi:hypothetical protein
MLTAKGWSRKFDDPIVLPGGRQLTTLRDAGTYHRGPFIPPRAINSGSVLGFPIRSYAMVGSGAMVGTVRI